MEQSAHGDHRQARRIWLACTLESARSCPRSRVSRNHQRPGKTRQSWRRAESGAVMSTLNLFPARVPIGYADSNGQVLMTPEFFRALTDLLQRVGGPSAPDNADLDIAASIAQAPVIDFSPDRKSTRLNSSHEWI